PKEPIQDLIDLHMAANQGYRKLIRTLNRLKENRLVRGQAAEDGGRLMEANDGDMLRCDDPKSVTHIVQSGQTLQILSVVCDQLKQLFSSQVGNLDIMGGLSPQSKPAHQDAMLNQNSSQSIA